MNYYWNKEEGEEDTHQGSEEIEKPGQVELR